MEVFSFFHTINSELELMSMLLLIPPIVNHKIHKWVGHFTAADEIIHHYQPSSKQTLEHRQVTSLGCQDNFLWLIILKTQGSKLQNDSLNPVKSNIKSFVTLKGAESKGRPGFENLEHPEASRLKCR